MFPFVVRSSQNASHLTRLLRASVSSSFVASISRCILRILRVPLLFSFAFFQWRQPLSFSVAVSPGPCRSLRDLRVLRAFAVRSSSRNLRIASVSSFVPMFPLPCLRPKEFVDKRRICSYFSRFTLGKPLKTGGLSIRYLYIKGEFHVVDYSS